MNADANELIGTCLDRLVDGEWSVKECLENAPELRDELAPLLLLANQLAIAGSVRASSQFRQDAGARLQQRISMTNQVARKEPILKSHPWYSRPTAIFATIFLALLVFGLAGFAGIARVADAAVPGEALYQLDLSLEQVQVGLVADATQRSTIQLAHAQERLDEALSLTREQDVAHAQEALVAYGVQMQEVELGAGVEELSLIHI